MIDLFCSSRDGLSLNDELGDLSFKKTAPESKNKSDIMIADALKHMSIADREQATNDVHGISEDIVEDPNFIQECLNMQREALVKLKSDSSLPSAAINLAESKDPTYVNNQRFLLKFLRADRYDPKLAAERMIRYFDLKLFLFGESRLCKDITFDDLQPEDVKMIKKGHAQILPTRDRAGREVRVFIAKNQKYKSIESLVSSTDAKPVSLKLYIILTKNYPLICCRLASCFTLVGIPTKKLKRKELYSSLSR